MTIDANKAHEVSDGLLVYEKSSGNTIEGPLYTGGPSVPLGLNLPENTFYVQNRSDGNLIWRKFGNGVNDWAVQENLYRTGAVAYDVYVPVDNVHIAHNEVFEGEIFIDGEIIF